MLNYEKEMNLRKKMILKQKMKEFTVRVIVRLVLDVDARNMVLFAQKNVIVQLPLARTGHQRILYQIGKMIVPNLVVSISKILI